MAAWKGLSRTLTRSLWVSVFSMARWGVMFFSRVAKDCSTPLVDPE